MHAFKPPRIKTTHEASWTPAQAVLTASTTAKAELTKAALFSVLLKAQAFTTC